jgi:hypothetical protein
MHMNMKCRAETSIFENYCGNQRSISGNWNARGIDGGSVGHDWDLRDHNPSSFASFKGFSALPNIRIEEKQTRCCNDARAYGDFIEELSCTKLRFAAVSLLGISLIVFGGRFLTYGERLGDLRSDVAYWFGYGISVAGGTALLLLAASVLAHWVYL